MKNNLNDLDELNKIINETLSDPVKDAFEEFKEDYNKGETEFHATAIYSGEDIRMEWDLVYTPWTRYDIATFKIRKQDDKFYLWVTDKDETGDSCDFDNVLDEKIENEDVALTEQELLGYIYKRFDEMYKGSDCFEYGELYPEEFYEPNGVGEEY